MVALTEPAEETLVVSEVFGPTIQGEGPGLGRRAGFIRLMGCNLHCSWCDTPYTWNATRFDLRIEGNRRPVTDIVDRALQGNPVTVVITGGEPLLHQHQPGWTAMLKQLTDAGVDIEVETNGTVEPDAETIAHVTRFNVSPKLAHGGDSFKARYRPDVLAMFRDTGRAVFKFVCQDPGDITEVVELAYNAEIPRYLVWIMPMGVTPAAVTTHLKILADPAITAGFNLTTRLHVLCWSDERGR
jgi:7-carboxy-7-deazaguanine synthase